MVFRATCAAMSIIAFNSLIGCGQHRMAGSSEAFGIHSPSSQTLFRHLAGVTTNQDPKRDVPNQPGWGDRVRSNEDVVTVIVNSAFVNSVPLVGIEMLDPNTGYDVILFAETQENAAAGYKSPPLTSVIYQNRDVQFPGLLNFKDAIAYGPTLYKGHPLKIKFTLMILVTNAKNRVSSIVDIVGGIAGIAAPQYAEIASEGVGVIRAILRAQPDVVAFDFEWTFLSDNPEGLLRVVGDRSKPPPTIAKGDATKSLIAATGACSAFPVTNVDAMVNFFVADSTAIKALSKIDAADPSTAEKAKSTIKTCIGKACGASLTTKELAVLNKKAPNWSKSFADQFVKAHVKRKDKTVLGNRKWDEYWPWLSYGLQAIVEVVPYRKWGKMTPAIGLTDELELKGPYIVKKGTSKKIATNYMVFSIVPGQIEQDDETLRAASELNSTLLASISRSDESLAQAAEDIKTFGKKLTAAILKARAEREARKLRRKEKSCEEFHKKFNKSINAMATSLIGEDGEDDSDTKNLANSIRKDILNNFLSKEWIDGDKCSSSENINKAVEQGEESLDTATTEEGS
jgi:hypothetical protein